MNREAEIQARLDNATPGPWEVDGPWWHGEAELAEATGVISAGEERDAVAIMPPSWARVAKGANDTFIANAPTDITYLLDEIMRLREAYHEEVDNHAKTLNKLDAVKEKCEWAVRNYKSLKSGSILSTSALARASMASNLLDIINETNKEEV